MLKFDNGKVFPPNVVVMAYVFLAVSIFSFLSTWWLGLILFIVSMFILTTKMKVEIDLAENTYREFTHFFQIIKMGKTFDLNSFKYVSVIPKRQSTVMYSRASNSNIQTNFFHVVCILNENFRAKKEVLQLESKNKANLLAQDLSIKLKMDYFEYDPQKVREFYSKK